MELRIDRYNPYSKLDNIPSAWFPLTASLITKPQRRCKKKVFNQLPGVDGIADVNKLETESEKAKYESFNAPNVYNLSSKMEGRGEKIEKKCHFHVVSRTLSAM